MAARCHHFRMLIFKTVLFFSRNILYRHYSLKWNSFKHSLSALHSVGLSYPTPWPIVDYKSLKSSGIFISHSLRIYGKSKTLVKTFSKYTWLVLPVFRSMKQSLCKSYTGLRLHINKPLPIYSYIQNKVLDSTFFWLPMCNCPPLNWAITASYYHPGQWYYSWASLATIAHRGQW